MTTSNDNKTFSLFVERVLPKFVSEDHPKFVEFTKKYFEFLEQKYNSIDLIVNYLFYSDIDTIIDDLKSQYYEVYTQRIPQDFCNSFAFFIKHIREFYQMKGTENSYRYFFREFYDSKVEFYYPGTDVLRASSNTWYSPVYIVTEEQDSLNQWVENFIQGNTSGATAFVEKTSAKTYGGTIKTALSLIDVEGDFVGNETITILNNDSIEDQTIADNGVFQGASRWLNKESFLSSDKYLQDNYYYQDFSYVLRSNISLPVYEETIKDIIHPAGMQLFGELPFLALDEMDVQEIFVEMTKWLIEWINELERQIFLEMNLGDIKTFRNLYVVNNPFKVTYKYFEDNRETIYFEKTWQIGDFDHHTIDDFENYPNELIHPIANVAEITIN